MLGKGLGGNHGAVDVQVKDHVHAVIVQVEEGLDAFLLQIAGFIVFLVGGGPGIVAAGAVEQDVARAQIPEDFLSDALHIFPNQHVALVGLGGTALGNDLIVK